MISRKSAFTALMFEKHPKMQRMPEKKGESRVKELRVNKKLKKKIVGRGYKNTHEWIQAKIKRIIFIDIFAAIPEVAALIALVDSLFSNDDDIILIVTGVWCSTALILSLIHI